MADGTPPKSIAFIHCVGSRDKNYKDYCSGVCCAASLKLAHLAKKKLGGDVKIYGVYSDWCLPGKGYQEFYNSLLPEGYEYVRVENPNAVQIAPKDKGLEINYGAGAIQADIVVLASAMVPAAGTDELAAMLGLSKDKYGFLAAEHERISPAGTTTRGIYVAGCATGPKDFPQSVLHAQAAAGMALSAIVPGEKIELEAATSQVDEKLCGGCRVCVSLCPYQAIAYDEQKKSSVINEVLCKGCGVCVSGCPAGAISNKHFTNEQIASEIEGVLHE
jgi:heterodisulfide reductase subunit A